MLQKFKKNKQTKSKKRKLYLSDDEDDNDVKQSRLDANSKPIEVKEDSMPDDDFPNVEFHHNTGKFYLFYFSLSVHSFLGPNSGEKILYLNIKSANKNLFNLFLVLQYCKFHEQFSK